MNTPGAADLADLLATAEAVARQGGVVLTGHQQRLHDLKTEFKGRRTELVTAADRAAEELVVGQLIAAFPGHGILAEEGVLTPVGQASAAATDPLWIVDPLDGTTNFVHGLPFYAVAIALVVAGEPIVAVVHAPALDWTFTAVRGGGAKRNGAPLRVSRTAELGAALLATGFSYNRSEPGVDDNVVRMQRALHAARDVRRFGSAELDLCMCAAGQNDGYWEMYLQPYDVAAGALIVREAGGLVTDLAGGGDWLYGGHIAASNGLLHRSLLDTIGGAPGTPAALRM